MSDKKQTITFTEAVEVLDHNNKVEFEGKAGEVVELSAASAAHWISRGKAKPGQIKLKAATGSDETTVAADKALTALKEANARLDKATAVPITADGAEKELDLATKHQAKKQKEYDNLVAKNAKD